MALLTPPHSSCKENPAKFALTKLNVDVKMQASTSTATPSSSRSVVWSPQNSYHSLATPAKTPPTAASTNAWVKERPVRSILKRKPHPLADTTNGPRASTSKSTPTDVTDLTDLPEDLDTHFRTRESTPAPQEPLTNLDYLNYPVSLIVKEDAKPREIIEGYSILAARLRTNVQLNTEADASWPLFQPLRKQRTRFVECVVRDLGRALVDPTNTPDCPASEEEEEAMKEWVEEDEASGLPSPQRSPQKPKKKGMTAAQVKYARDLCTISHAAIKLLCLVFAVPAIFSVFEDKELKAMLHAVLAIPLADSLPTPNARKTCALAILLIQAQRLPESVVYPARDRIAQSLRRGINGELGKEGKKGSANDGLKAIHDLSLFQPNIFVPLFANGLFLRNILHCLLASTLSLRVQACHALGGVAYALAGLPPSSIHATASDIVLEFVMTPAPATPTKTTKSTPSLPPKDSSIIRTLRATMGATDATHIGQSPVWAVSVLSSLIVLIGSRMYTSKKTCCAMLNVLKLAAKIKKPSIRYLFNVAWRTLTWVWFQPDYDTLQDDGEDEKTDSESSEEADSTDTKHGRDGNKDKMREVFFSLLHECPEHQSGIATVVTLLNCSPPSTANALPRDSLNRALNVLQAMADSACADITSDAAQILLNMVTPPDSPRPSTSAPFTSYAILPRGLFSSPPNTGLLSVDLAASGAAAGSVLYAVKALFDDAPNLDHVPALSRDDMRNPWVWSKISRIWRRILTEVEMSDNADLPEELVRVWEALVLAKLGSADEEEGEKDAGSEEERVEKVVDVLISILEDDRLDLRMKDDESPLLASTSKVPFPSSDGPEGAAVPPSKHTRQELKIKVVKSLFMSVRTVASKEQLCGQPLYKLFTVLVDPKNVAVWTAPRSSAPLPPRKRPRGKASSLSLWSGGSSASVSMSKEALAPISGWTSLIVNVMSVAEGAAAKDMMQVFWGLAPLEDTEESLVTAWDAEVKASVWKTVVNAWRKNEAAWDGAVVLLAAPFACSAPSAKAMWTFSKEERDKWEVLYDYTVGKASDFGFDGAAVVDASPMSTPRSCVSTASSNPAYSDIVLGSLIQVSDLLLEHLDISEARDLPSSLITLVSETMKLAYPVSAVNSTHATWLAASVAQAVEKCPKSLVKAFIEGVCDSLALWLADESESWSESALDNTFVSLYENLLLCITEIPEDLEFLEKISPFLESVFSGSRALPSNVMASFKAAFQLFWESGPYSKMEEPTTGWPLNLNRCLGLEEVVVAPTSLSLVDDGDSEEPLAVPSTPKQAGYRKLDAGAPRTPMAHMNGMAHILSPHRPHKASIDGTAPLPSSDFPREPWLFGTSALGLAPGPEIVESPTKRRRVDSENERRGDKENASPLRGRGERVFASPLRAGGRIPAPLFQTSAGETEMKVAGGEEPKTKRRRMRDRMGAKKPQQKRDVSPAGSAASTRSARSNSPDDEEEVAKSLVPFPSVEDSPERQPVEAEEPVGGAKKRKRTIVDASLLLSSADGEPVATRRRKLEHASSFDSALHSAASTAATTTPTKSQDELKTPALKKRKRSSSLTCLSRTPFFKTATEDPFQTEVSAGVPLPPLHLGGMRKFEKEEEEEGEEEQAEIPSSDDDPRYGQVTPHHIISPPLAQKAGKVYVSKAKQNAAAEVADGHRHVSFQEVEGSDDDYDSMAEPPSSPSKKVAERRMLQRQGSQTKT